jgi:hypothetical protein
LKKGALPPLSKSMARKLACWRINNKDKKQVTSIIEGVGQINLMEDVCMTCANMCGVQLAILDVSKFKPLLYQLAWKFIKFFKNKKTKTWMCNNKDAIVHLPMVFMGKLLQFFQYLASFPQNSINTTRLKLATWPSRSSTSPSC